MIKNLMFPKYDDNGCSRLVMPNTKSIVFLDFDGVIIPYNNDSRWYHDLKKLAIYLSKKYRNDIYLKVPEGDLGGAFFDWDLTALGRLRKILDETASEIVIHSDYRIFDTLEQLKAMFRLYGMDEYILDVCEKGPDKEEAIRNYLYQNSDNIENYVVLDDNPELDVFNDHFVLTNDYLKDEDVEKTLKILMR